MEERQLRWRKSSWSGTQGECVEVALTDDCAHVRDSKDREGGTLRMPMAAWEAFINAIKVAR